ncbi:hypothetical protein M885DRAFT_545250 [Pelagophyceae sp. CCMP2097]|nr:hypothetical protein M885DRAFT_545250 [Pelagophyceae sp. CCMP2097]
MGRLRWSHLWSLVCANALLRGPGRAPGVRRRAVPPGPADGEFEPTMEGDALIRKLNESQAGRLILQTLTDQGRPYPRRMPTMVELIETTERELEAHLSAKADEVQRQLNSPNKALADFGLRNEDSSVFLDHLEMLTAAQKKNKKRQASKGRLGRKSSLGAAGDGFCAAIVLGKAMKQGRLSVEMAARISGLVRAMRDERVEPDVVIFTPSAAGRPSAMEQSEAGTPDDASVACAYFVHLCDSVGLDVPECAMYVSTTPLTTRDSMRRLLATCIYPRLREKKAKYASGALSLHAAFFASGYLLQRLERVQHITPRLSLFAPLAERDGRLNDRNEFHEAQKQQQRKRKAPDDDAGEEVGATTWSLEAVRYPPALLADGDAALNHPDAHVGAVGTAKGPMATLFLARTHVIFDSLMPLLLNVRAVVGKEEFLSREYYEDLLVARKLLAVQLALVESPLRPAGMRALPIMSSISAAALAQGLHASAVVDEDMVLNADGSAADPLDVPISKRRPLTSDVEPPLLDEALETILGWLAELTRLLRPAAMRTGDLSVEDWRHALRLLQKTMTEGRAATDPDRALAAAEWGRLLDEEEIKIADFIFDWHQNDELAPFDTPRRQ